MTSLPDPRRWLALAVILSATLLGVLDFLIVNLALPSMKASLKASDAQMQLTVALYGLAFAVCLVLGGRLGDIYGRKRVFLWGMGGFTLASALCGFAQNANQLVAFRVVQGAFGALMSPQVLATIQVTFSGQERDRATGYVGATVGVGSFLGNVVGGWLVHANLFGLEWRPIFFVNVPIGIVAMALAWFLVRESKSDSARSLDVGGALLLGVTLFLLVFPIVEGRQNGWPAWVFAMFAGSALFALVFWRYEVALNTREGSPLISLELFANNAYKRGLGAILCLFSGLSSFSFVLGQVLQNGFRLSTDKAGAIFGALSLSFLIASLGAVKVVGRYGPRALLVGLAMLQIGQAALIALMLVFRGALNPYWLAPVLFFYGLGQGLAVPQVIRQTMNTVGGDNAGAASGVLSTVQQVAFSLGVSAVGGVFFAVASQGLARGATPSPDAFALGTAVAFGLNFLFVTTAFFLMNRNLKLSPTTSSAPVAVEA